MWNFAPTNFYNDPEKILISGFFLRGKTREESRKCACNVTVPKWHGPSNSGANGDSNMVWLLTEGHRKTKVSTTARDTWERHQEGRTIKRGQRL